MKTYLKLNDISAYKKSLSLSNYVWGIVLTWDKFARDTVGKQFVRAIDSISANIAEGFGRYTKKDKINFYRISFGSIKESFDWNEKPKSRKMLRQAEYNSNLRELSDKPREDKTLISFTNERLQK